MLHPVEDAFGGRVRHRVDDPSVDEKDDLIGEGRRAGIVGDHHDGLVELANGALEKRQHLGSGPGVQVAGGLVCEDDVRPGHQGAGTRDPLLLAAGKLRRAVAQARREPDGVDHLRHPLAVGLAAGDVEGKRDVLGCGQRRQQIELLEHEADAVTAKLGERLVRQSGEVHGADEDLAPGHGVKTGQAMHQRRLARPGRPHDRGKPPAGEGNVDIAQCGHRGLSGSINLDQAGSPRRGNHVRPRTARGVSRIRGPHRPGGGISAGAPARSAHGKSSFRKARSSRRPRYCPTRDRPSRRPLQRCSIRGRSEYTAHVRRFFRRNLR